MNQYKLEPLLEKQKHVQAQIAEQEDILTKEATKPRAWKSVRTVQTTPQPDSGASIAAKKRIGQLEQELAAVSLRVREVENILAKIEQDVREDKEVEEWGANLRLPRDQRVSLPEPARIQRMEARQRKEWLGTPGPLVRLRLVRTLADLEANRNTLLALTKRRLPPQRVAPPPEEDDDSITVISEDDELEEQAEYVANIDAEGY